MKGDAKVIEYLNKALRHELTAVNQYWLHYRLLDNWGYKDLAKQWRKESIEEMEHADKLVERVIFLDGFPNLQVLDPLHIGQNVKEVLDCDLAAEMSARALYQEAATHCHSVKDYVTRDLFEKLMSDEEHHIDFLETQLDLVAKLGLELYAQHHIGEMGEGTKDRASRASAPRTIAPTASRACAKAAVSSAAEIVNNFLNHDSLKPRPSCGCLGARARTQFR
jgi:bacterioferritin